MVSRLRVMCLSLGILSTVVGCAAPPPMAPLRATLAPAAPAAVAPPATPAPADLLPAGEPLPSVPPTLYADLYPYFLRFGAAGRMIQYIVVRSARC